MKGGVDKIVSPVTKMSHHTQTGPSAGVTANSCMGRVKKIDKVSQWIDLVNATGQKAKHTPVDHNLKTRPEAAKLALTGIVKTGQKAISEGMLNLNPLGDRAKESLGLLE